MKKIFIFFFLTAICIFASCEKTVESDNKAIRDSVQTTQTTTRTTVTTIKATTTTVTTICPDDPPESVVLDTLTTVEVYNEITVDRFITDTNTELHDGGTLLDTSDLGERSVKIRFGYEGKTYEKELKYNVVDTTEPMVLNSGWSPYTLIDQPFDINSVIGYVDNYDRHPTVTYEGDVDTSEVGGYPITVTVRDSSGNSTSWDMSIFVTHEKPGYQDNNDRVSFSDFCAAHPYDNVSYGIDVSAWQTNVDYEAVKSDGCEFVIMRMGYYYDHVVMDDYYRQNMDNATAAGLQVGVYFYTADNTEEGVREHARWIVEQLDGRQLDFPVAFDWEEWGTFQEYGMNIHDLNCLFDAFCDELEKNGYTGMLYSSKNFLNNFWTNKNNRPVWLAHFVDETDYTGDYSIWQGSAYGRINGIAGDVDMNIRYNDRPLN